MQPWKIWIDTGGTFTDCIALDPDGRVHRCKVLSSARLRGRIVERLGPRTWRMEQHWGVDADIFAGYRFRLTGHMDEEHEVQATDMATGIIEVEDLPQELELPCFFEIWTEEEAPVLAARLVTQTPLGQPLPPLEMRLGTTKGTNALLEGQTARVTLVTTRGFADLPYIGTQQRPHLFQSRIPEPVLLHDAVVEVEERIGANGEVIEALSAEHLEAVVNACQQNGTTAVAVALLHAWCNPIHERSIEMALRQAGWQHVSTSHALMPGIKLLPRMQTALVDAGLTPVLDDYLRKITSSLSRGSQLHVMTSAGGLVSSLGFRAKDSLLSGPAGGVVGAGAVAKALGYERVLTLDMGGTSTDTARYEGRADYAYTTRVAGVELSLPCMRIETVAAGGGSICWFDGHKLCVGPRSAGASPGPACYGAGGPFTITDVNLLLGKLDPSAMGIPVSREAAMAALRSLAAEVEAHTGQKLDEMELLRGFERIADEKMAEAIRRISVARGFDPRDHALLVFGGAGGLHACRIAELLHMRTVILPYDGGLLSAFGMGRAGVERMVHRQVLLLWNDCQTQLDSLVAEASADALRQLAQEGIEGTEAKVREVLVYLRFRGQEQSLELSWQGNAEALVPLFEEKYRELYGHLPQGLPVEVESIKVFATGGVQSGLLPPDAVKTPRAAEGVRWWDSLEPGERLEGPLRLLHRFCTAWVAPGWSVHVREGRNVVLELSSAEEAVTSSSPRSHFHFSKKEKKAPPQAAARAGHFLEKENHHGPPPWADGTPGHHGQADPIGLELFTNRFTAIAEEMGALLQRTAFSVNIKERMDFSCALLTPQAHLLVNAPHIPVHLGSLGVCARLVLEVLPLGPGDVALTNHPRYGGSHLPDLTLLAPVYEREDGGRLLGYVINRAHHAELGGRRPGSMPPDARTLVEEGVVFAPMRLVEGGSVHWDRIERMLLEAPWPSRAPRENMADLKAALASLHRGASMLRQLAQQHGAAVVWQYMQGLQGIAEAAIQEVLLPWRGQRFEAEEHLDDGHRIKVAIEVDEQTMRIDFSGTSGVHPFNLNANVAIVYSVVIYVLRLLCGRDIPLNEGLMRGVDIVLPPGCFLHPDFADDPAACPAVVGGNTEVSQRLVDTLLKALSPLAKVACSQGTMNNLLFGNRTFGYYETIGGGAGAGAGFHGRSGVHQHMTNTRITDPEDLEFRYPVRLRRFALRRGSGGKGCWQGGDGIVRELEFLEAVEVTLLTQHRVERPYGLEGGSAGAAGQQYLIRANGERLALGGVDSCDAEPGDRLVVETPGGGGYGSP